MLLEYNCERPEFQSWIIYISKKENWNSFCHHPNTCLMQHPELSWQTVEHQVTLHEWYDLYCWCSWADLWCKCLHFWRVGVFCTFVHMKTVAMFSCQYESHKVWGIFLVEKFIVNILCKSALSSVMNIGKKNKGVIRHGLFTFLICTSYCSVYVSINFLPFSWGKNKS